MEPGKRAMGLLKERDFLFYEDVLMEKRRRYSYELVKAFEVKELPLDWQGKSIFVYRRAGKPKASTPKAASMKK